MPDRPDWYDIFPGSTRFPTTDVGELAARMGSPVVYDRRGEVIFADAFRAGLAPYATSLAGTGAEAKVAGLATDLGPFAAELIGGSDGAGEAVIRKWFSRTTLGRTGLEVSIWYVGAFDEMLVTLGRYDGTNAHLAALKIEWTSGVLSYLDSAGAYQQLDTNKVWATSDAVYHNVKLIADMENDEYVRILYDEETYDLEDIAMQVTASAVDQSHLASFTIASRSGQNDSCQVGRFIVTGNEP